MCAVAVGVVWCKRERGEEGGGVPTEIRGYLFSIRMSQVRQASNEETEVQTRERRRRGRGGRGSVAVSLLHITVSKRLKASLFSKESQNVSSVGRERHTRTARGVQPCTEQIHFEASMQATCGLMLISHFVQKSCALNRC